MELDLCQPQIGLWPLSENNGAAPGQPHKASWPARGAAGKSKDGFPGLPPPYELAAPGANKIPKHSLAPYC